MDKEIDYSCHSKVINGLYVGIARKSPAIRTIEINLEFFFGVGPNNLYISLSLSSLPQVISQDQSRRIVVL